MEALIRDIFTFLLQYYALYFVIIMGIFTAIIVVALNLLKKPFKALTSKIQNTRLRKFINNCVIILCSFGLSVGLWFLMNWLMPDYFAIDFKMIFLNGAMPVVSYAFAEGWITSDKAKEIISNTVDKVSDGELTTEEVKDTAKELNKALNTTTTTTTKTVSAEKELNKLLKK